MKSIKLEGCVGRGEFFGELSQKTVRRRSIGPSVRIPKVVKCKFSPLKIVNFYISMSPQRKNVFINHYKPCYVKKKNSSTKTYPYHPSKKKIFTKTQITFQNPEKDKEEDLSNVFGVFTGVGFRFSYPGYVSPRSSPVTSALSGLYKHVYTVLYGI